VALFIDFRDSLNPKIKHKKNRTVIHLPLSWFSTICRCQDRLPLVNLHSTQFKNLALIGFVPCYANKIEQYRTIFLYRFCP